MTEKNPGGNNPAGWGTPEHPYLYRDIFLGIVCCLGLVFTTGALLSEWPMPGQGTRRFLVSLGVILLCLLLARGSRLLVFSVGCLLVAFRGMIGFAFTGESLALLLAIAYGLVGFFLIYFGARLEVGLGGASSPEQRPNHRDDSQSH